MLFISFKDGFSRDIQKANISSWRNQNVQLAHQSFNLETQNVYKVKAYGIHSMVASLAFKEGVPLDQILVACSWKSHSTFTNFNFKDVAWKSGEVSVYSLGPVVSVQHVVYL